MIRFDLAYSILNQFQFVKYGDLFDITIIDDVFPFHISPWRNIEYLEIADRFKTRIFSDGLEYNRLLPPNTKYRNALTKFNKVYPYSKIYPKKLKLFSPLNTKLSYFLFYGYLLRYKKHIYKHKVNLCFNIYPGGGFDTHSSEVKMNLIELTQYSRFKDVIVTQNYSRDYLINEIGVPSEKVHTFKNVILLPEFLSFDPFVEKKWYGINKSTFDVAFVANKYVEGGADKGFDVFLSSAKTLLRKYNFINFHIVGGFTINDIPKDIPLDNFNFYGFRDFNFFINLYKNVDAFISPNKPFVKGGNFDGFPLGTSYEAGLCGAVVMMTDYLNENECYINGEDYLNINEGVDQIIAYIDDLIKKPDSMSNFVKNFRKKTIDYSQNNITLKNKLSVLSNIINNI